MIKLLYPSEIEEGMKVSAYIKGYGRCHEPISGETAVGPMKSWSIASNNSLADGSGNNGRFKYGWLAGDHHKYYGDTYIVWQGKGDPKKRIITALLFIIETHNCNRSDILGMLSSFIRSSR